MPPITEVTVDQLAAVRSGGYAGEVRFAVAPMPVVFQAEVNQTITARVFFSFLWTNATTGAYGDVNEGQTFFITATDDPAELRNPLHRGRVTQPLNGTTFFCDEASFNLFDGYIVTVIDLYEIKKKPRYLALVDGWLPFEDLPPVAKNMQAHYYGENDTSYQFSFSPVGQALKQGDSVTDYHWTIPGATYDVGDADSQAITVTVAYGHRWAFLDMTTAGGVTQRLKFEILVCPRDDPDFMYMATGTVDISSELDSGIVASTTLFDGVENLLDRARCAIIAFDLYADGNPADPQTEPLFNQVVFVGYIVAETTEVTADEKSSLLSSTRFELQSFAAVAAALPVPSLAIRNRNPAAAWEQMRLPTPERNTIHIGVRYSTLFDLAPCDVGLTDATYFGGEMDFEASMLMDSIRQMLEEIDARLVWFPGGDCAIEIDANALSEAERDALPELLASGSIGTADLFTHTLPIPYYDTIAKLEVGYATFPTAGGLAVKLQALAPATALGEGNETPIIRAKLLASDLSQTLAIAAAKERVGNLFEYMQPPVLLPATFHDGWRFLTVSSRVWLRYNLPGNDNTRGVPVTDAERYLLQSLTLRWDPRGTWDITGTARRETQGGSSQLYAAILPEVIVTDTPVLPIGNDYSAGQPYGSLNAISTDPAAEDAQPYSPYGMVQFQPMTTEDAAQEANNTPEPGCYIVRPALSFKSSDTRLTPFVTVNGEPYRITVKGRARISSVVAGCYDNNTAGAYFDLISGTVQSDPSLDFVRAAGSNLYAQFEIDFGTQVVHAGGSMIQFQQIIGGGFGPDDGDLRLFDGVSLVATLCSRNNPSDGGYFWQQLNSGTSGEVFTRAVFRYRWANGIGDVRGQICIGGATAIFDGDAFYQIDTATGVAELYPPTRGLRINSMAVSVPPEYNPSGMYEIAYEGDGNQVPFSFLDDDYADNQNLPLYIRVCGPNAGD